ncbi:AraC family transcriptional regulator [Paenibacillus agricola]|uniref:Helix-turn-helix transcriptional regulator n=1 Tax=Paenibacillus agricola TaxID=2716264 RepID=A0ABX0JB34_9BACL|nr:AraC family transcriptional regulator [Paenibacillus agricola]NHN33629.1 helix-turn-helix transcriptional regulator [Paenibacillus agricola]
MFGNGRFFRKSLITVLIIASLPGLFIGIAIYFVGSHQISEELNTIHQQQLLQAQKSIDNQLSTLEVSLSHWAFDPQFDEKLRRLDTEFGYSQVQDIYKTLLVMKELNPLIQQVSLYLEEPKPLLFTENGYERLGQSDYPKYHQLLDQPTSTQWIHYSSSLQSDKRALTEHLSLLHKIPGGSPRPFGVFLVSVDPVVLDNMITLLTPRGEGTSFLVKKNGEWLSPAARSGQVRDLDEALRAKVMEQGEARAPFVYTWEGELYSVSYGIFSRLNQEWIYVSATPLQSLTAPVVFISRLILAISSFGLLLAAILSWFASKQLYSPIKKLVQLYSSRGNQRMEGRDEFELIESVWNHVTRESQNLQSLLERQLPQVREGFLLQLLQGYLTHLSESDLQERIENLGFGVKESRFSVIFIQLLGFSNLQGRFFEGDEVLVTFAASNIVKELAENAMQKAEAINFHDLTVGLLICSPPAEPISQWKARVVELLKEITVRLNTLLHVRVVIGFGAPAPMLSDIPDILEATRQAIRFRDVREDNQIFDLEELVHNIDKPLVYPFQLEREVVQAVRMGSEEEAIQAVQRFLDELRAHAAKELWVQQGMLHLLGSVQNAMMHIGTNLHELYEGLNLYEQLCQLKEPEAIGKWFQVRVLSPFMQDIRRKQDLLMHKLVERVIFTIQERYMDDISLDAIAESHRLSSYTLSRTFKLMTGINFIDYLTEVRLEKAKELLRDTDWKLHEVAERVGYQPSYFGRIFKKNVGVTPNRYRESMKENKPII